MTHTDAQIEIALLASIERQANRTAAALERVLALRRELKNSEKELKRQCRQRRQPRR